MAEMSKEEIARFVMQGTFTGKLATVRKDGSSHVVPIWYVLDNENNKRIGNIIFTTYTTSVKANNIRRNNSVSICIDDQTRPFSFVTIFGRAIIHGHKHKEVLKWATKIAERYMGTLFASGVLLYFCHLPRNGWGGWAFLYYCLH
jgi:PPOX class probable F420-dependent enzyme